MKAATNAPANRVVRKIRIRAILFLVLALVAGAGAVVLVKNYLDQMGAARRSVALATTQVAVAAVDVPIGTPLTKEHLAVTQWPTKHLPPGTFSDVKLVIGRTNTFALMKGEPVIAGRLADENAGRGLTALLGKGMRAMAVKVDQVIGVAGFVMPGDYVDVITTMAPDEETKKELKDESARVSKIFLQNIRVLAVGEHMTTQGTKPVKVQVVTLEVDPEQSERLALASRHGEIQLTMRSRIDQQRVPSGGVTPVALLAPDEGAEKKKDLSPDEKSTMQWIAARQQRKRVGPKPKPEEKKPEAPVIEVLRGDKIEERKVKVTADSK